MSVLFFLGKWDVGGVECVTLVLANALIRRGFGVCIVACEIGDRSLAKDLDPAVAFVGLGPGWLCASNRRMVARLIAEHKVDVVVNQWCVPYAVTRFLRGAMKESKARLVAVHHNRPNANRRIQNARNGLTHALWWLVSALNARFVYDRSDLTVVLSESFVPVLRSFIRRPEADRIVAIGNPLTREPVVAAKEKLILYVGRLEETQKRVSRVVETWSVLAPEYPDWRLVIVGDGPDRAYYEQLAAGLPRVEFVGFDDPGPWYARARILLLTSDFEGFGLVLTEAMAAACVPIALGCDPVISEIVGTDGTVVPTPYDAETFAAAVRRGIARAFDTAAVQAMAERTMKSFGIDACVDQWEELFEGLREEERTV